MCDFCSMSAGHCDFDGAAAIVGSGITTFATTTGLKWGAFPLGMPGGVVTWSLAGAGVDITNFPQNQMSMDFAEYYPFDMEAVVREAFAIWSAAANIEFVQVVDDGVASAATNPLSDIRIFRGLPVENFNLGYANFPGSFSEAGDVLIATASDLRTLSPEGTPDFMLHLVLHEIGHAIGLGHSGVGAAVMNSFVALSNVKTTLHPDDVDGIISTYGPQDGGPMVYEIPGDQSDLELIYTPAPLTVQGNALANRILATGADETLEGGAGPDTLEAGAGDDVLSGGQGHDVLDGGAGEDRAKIAGGYIASAVSVGPDQIVIAEADGGTETLRDVEGARYDNGLLLFDLPGSEVGFVFRLYEAAFDRPADAGLLFWHNERLEGTSREELAQFFVDSPEFAALYGTDPSDVEFVDALYMNVLDRGADEAGKLFWTDAFADGLTRADMLTFFAESPENVAATAPALENGLFFAGVDETVLA